MPVTVKFDPASQTPQAQVIGDVNLFNDGVMTSAMLADLLALVAGSGFVKVYSPRNSGAPLRPAASAVGATPLKFVVIVNFDDKQLNYAGTYDGGLTYQWYDFSGILS
jgi:hypothetical protein